MLGNTDVSKEALYRAMVELALDALLVLEGAVFVDCNSSAEKLFGVSRTQLLASTPLDFSEYIALAMLKPTAVYLSLNQSPQ
ncbi:PAS domain-containing protein [Undibacterium piscinae]|uniref:PAS domain-containing protein n=1 Tax=Undibacterium piscinae TaxID=2495591 RepID=A0A6M4A629_9BURK|nr:PAS domain-containing protein [Undibacterium piscinae]